MGFGGPQQDALQQSQAWQGAAGLEVGCAGNDMGVGHDVAVSVPNGPAAGALRHLLHEVQRELVPPALPNAQALISCKLLLPLAMSRVGQQDRRGRGSPKDASYSVLCRVMPDSLGVLRRKPSTVRVIPRCDHCPCHPCQLWLCAVQVRVSHSAAW